MLHMQSIYPSCASCAVACGDDFVDGGADRVFSAKMVCSTPTAVLNRWPSAEVAVMGAKGAVEIIFRGKDVVEREKEYTELFCNPMVRKRAQFCGAYVALLGSYPHIQCVKT